MSGGGASPAPFGTLLPLEERVLATVHGEFRAHVFHDLASGRLALALRHGEVKGPEPLLARVHSSCVTSETYGGCDCDCAGQLDAALRRIAGEGRGVVFYLMQEGRGAGFAAKARDRMLVQASRQRLTTFEAYERMGLGGDRRRYAEVAFACGALGIQAPLRLLTNNPDKVAALEAEKLDVAGVLPLHGAPSPWNSHYLASKSHSGHRLEAPGAGQCAAELPEDVIAFAPHPVAGAPGLLRVASYLLPIPVAGAPRWFRLHLYFESAARREWVVFTYGDGARPLLRVQPESLFERFSLRVAPLRAGWRETLTRIVAHGAGCALCLPASASGDAAGESAFPAALLEPLWRARHGA
jgi:3,4-dihydroxy 2-butanone 4-phosphate synthase/GTP cyclohydrolase II